MKIIHLSDLHFGTERVAPLQALLADLKNIPVDLVVISGDLTQRATRDQYKIAHEFIHSIKIPVLTVPGNHDIPLYNLVMRLFFPFKNYKRWISKKLCMHLDLPQAAIIGINSATPYKTMGGYVTDEQLRMVLEFFKAQPKDKLKIVVMHHNLIHSVRHKIINDSEKIINVFSKANVNVVLSGHIHEPLIEELKNKSLSQHTYIITAGTAVSHRTIAQNSYNILEFFDSDFKLSIRDFDGNQFMTRSERIYPL